MISECRCPGSLTLITAIYVCLDILYKIWPPVTGQSNPVGGCGGSKVSARRPKLQSPHDLLSFLLF